MMDTLNLGCGNKVAVAEGWVNHDRIKHRPEVHVVWDLNETPWPWPDGSFDAVHASSVLEHLQITLMGSVNECHRILRPGGRIHLKIPYWKSEGAYNDPTHHWVFGLGVLDVFDPTTRRGTQYGFYTPRKWKIVEGPRLNKELTSIIATMEVIK